MTHGFLLPGAQFLQGYASRIKISPFSSFSFFRSFFFLFLFVSEKVIPPPPPHLLNKTQRFELLSSLITFVLEDLEILECLWGDNCQPKGNHIVLYTYQAKTKGVSKNSGDIVSWKLCKLNCSMITKN